jgi:hypothetical protein
VAYLEGPEVNPPGVVSSECLQVPCQSSDDDVPRFLEQVGGVLPCLLCFIRMIGLDHKGSTASEPYTIKNDVKLVDLLGVVRTLQSTEGTSAAHFLALVLSRAWTSSPSWVRMRGFGPYNIRPFVRRWVTAAQSTRMLLSSQKNH